MTRFGDAAFVPLAVTTRSGLDESLHLGAAVALAADGAVAHSAGDPRLVVYPRSSLKPFQVSAMVRLGLDLPHHLIAVAAASHSGERRHLDAVREILDLHALTVDHLGNTPAHPYGSAARHAAIAAGTPMSPLQQNCSGKHAAMLATCRINDWPIATYCHADHPLQQAIIDEVNRLAGRTAVEHVGVDGCGAPTHAMPLVDLAAAARQLVLEGSVVVASMATNADMVGGTDRDVTIWMEAVPGLVAKEGADGVMLVALPDGRAGAVKIADGSDSARRAATVELLRMVDVDVDGAFVDARDRVAVSVLGGGEVVGACRSLPWSS